jgi:hypothetical protein
MTFCLLRSSFLNNIVYAELWTVLIVQITTSMQSSAVKAVEKFIAAIPKLHFIFCGSNIRNKYTYCVFIMSRIVTIGYMYSVV